MLALLRPEVVVGIGHYARDRALAAVATSEDPALTPRMYCLTHPSPASPKANRGWHKLALSELLSFGLIMEELATKACAELCSPPRQVGLADSGSSHGNTPSMIDKG